MKFRTKSFLVIFKTFYSTSSINVTNQTNILVKNYQNLVDSKLLSYDAYQFNVVLKLNEFHKLLLNTSTSGNENENSKFNSIFKNLFKKNDEKKIERPQIKGIYLYGGVGCGKTMLMDMVYNIIPPNRSKLRIHFNKFMLNVHQDIHRIKIETNFKTNDPLAILADELSNKVNLLFFDEFQVTDIADAMIMQRLFTHLFQRGMILFSTSNRVPNDLYKNGLQRELFEPFIDVLCSYCDIINLDSSIDYRKAGNLSRNRVYFNCDFESHLLDDLIAKQIAKQDGEDEEAASLSNLSKFAQRTVDILGRQVRLDRTYKRILETNFKFMCEEARSAVDYLELCKEFDVIIMRDIPFIDMKSADSLRRFIVFIDTVYDHRTKFIASGKASAPQFLFTSLDGLSKSTVAQSETSKRPSLFTLEEEYFAIDRTISRLIDMQTDEYNDKIASNVKG